MSTLNNQPSQKEALEKFLKTTKNVHERERARAVLNLLKKKKRKEVAEIFDVNIGTLDLWKGNFVKYGVKGLVNKGYTGNHFKLSREQKEKIKEILYTQTPDQLNLSEKRFWNTVSLYKLIKERFNVVFKSSSTYRKLFYSLGFSCHKPGKHNRNQKPHLVKRFKLAVKKRSGNTRGWAIWSW